MPVTFELAQHPAEPVKATEDGPISSPEDLLARTWGKNSETHDYDELLQTSLSAEIPVGGEWSQFRPQQNGFVHTIVDAYNHHHHLVLRPDDVWVAILSQFNLFVNAHAAELRSIFVQHNSQKHLILRADGDRRTVNFGDLAQQLTRNIEKKILDKTLRDWILPDFSTTRANDTAICAILMMSALKSYFTYEIRLRCGIPSITLNGSKEDWSSVVLRLDKLASFGQEPAAFAELLRPVLLRFVQAFDKNELGEVQDIDFWSKICHVATGGSGPPHLSGWLTAFCVWNQDGQWMGPKLPRQPANTLKRVPRSGHAAVAAAAQIPLILDGVEYKKINFDNVPRGFCEVDIKLNDNGEIFATKMVSGHVGSVIEGEKRDTLKPLLAWFMFTM
ncbi:hypothetical protein CPB83DRAFT_546657 [Crepidotus variabilis]|uniref:Uncharacterized protein n=1 Tax=Crepidotus variabilis TaxID=179855 RepID=A0A9P6EA21_9AGAR|nr:hypothetical protein CPB83DRAFT_546657 [Crepidotus variabilis]